MRLCNGSSEFDSGSLSVSDLHRNDGVTSIISNQRKNNEPAQVLSDDAAASLWFANFGID